MTTLRIALFAGLASICFAGPAFSLGTSSIMDVSPVKQLGAQYAAVQCMTDDGYGRKRPCSAGFKKENPNWRAGDSCFTDEGNGRYRPCSAGYKAKHKK